MRARYPDREGYVESQGIKIFWEEFGDGPQTLLFLPTAHITHSRCYKGQVPYLSRYFRVITFDPPGNGKSDRPLTGYDYDTWTKHALAVMDATGTERASIHGLSRTVMATDPP